MECLLSTLLMDRQNALNMEGIGLDSFRMVNFALHMVECVYTEEGTRF